MNFITWYSYYIVTIVTLQEENGDSINPILRIKLPLSEEMMLFIFLIQVKERLLPFLYTELTNQKEDNIMTMKTYQLETVSCPSCIAKIEGALKKTAGITQSEVLFNSSRVKVAYDEDLVSSEKIKSKIENLGYKVLSEK